MIEKYQQIPTIVEVIKVSATNFPELIPFTGCTDCKIDFKGGILNLLMSIKGVQMKIMEDDYVIKDDSGKITVMKKAEFEQKYTKVKE